MKNRTIKLGEPIHLPVRAGIEDGETSMNKPTIVCLCGSTRFYKAFQRANYEETMAGRIVLSVGFYLQSSEQAHGETWGCTETQKVQLDELHKRKIDLADEILVLNWLGYVGESTQSEIDYARAQGKRVRWLEPPQCHGCTHSAMNMEMDAFCSHPKTIAAGTHRSNLSQRDPARDHCGDDKCSWHSRTVAIARSKAGHGGTR